MTIVIVAHRDGALNQDRPRIEVLDGFIDRELVKTSLVWAAS